MTVALPTPHQNPELDSFVSRLISKNKDSESHKSTVDSYFSFWDVDRAELTNEQGVSKRRSGSTVLTNNFYDLVTDFYEYGWGTSFHFAPMYKDSTFEQCISRHEDFLGLKLNLKAGQHCVDVGCGVGGPMRELVKFTGAKITGLNNNDYQVKRCIYLAEKTGLTPLCNAVKGSFDNMPFADNTFDAAYAIEATCHSSALENPYGEIYRTLKPGGMFACYEWLTTAKYDENNLTHKQIIHDLEEGNALPRLYTIPMAVAAAESVGFEIVEHYDLADTKSPIMKSQVGWAHPLKGSYSLSLGAMSQWKMTPLGRSLTDIFVWLLETIRIAPKGTRKVSQVLNMGADSLVKAADLELFTPMYFLLQFNVWIESGIKVLEDSSIERLSEKFSLKEHKVIKLKGGVPSETA